MNELNVMEIQQVLGGGSFRLRMTTSESGDVECALSYLHYTSVGSCTFSTIASAKPPLKIDPFFVYHNRFSKVYGLRGPERNSSLHFGRLPKAWLIEHYREPHKLPAPHASPITLGLDAAMQVRNASRQCKLSGYAIPIDCLPGSSVAENSTQAAGL